MNIAVVAANGRTGQAFVREALEQGHSIRAGVLGSSDIFRPHPKLTIVPCDATNQEDVMRLCQGQDAVVSLIGHVKGSAPNVQTLAIQNVLAAMQQQGIQRVVSLTGTGVRFHDDEIPFFDRVLNCIVSVIDSARVQDGRTHVAALEQSNTDWTIIRVLKLQDVPPKPYILRAHGPTKLYVGREEVAEAILQVLADTSFVHKAPILCQP